MKYRFKRPLPYRHQVAGVKKLLSNGFGGALLCEPRTGKTRMAIDYACIQHMRGEVSRVLVVCPVSVMGVWQEEIKRFSTQQSRVLVWDKDNRKRRQLPTFGKPGIDWVICNYDAFSTPGKKSKRNPKRRTRRGGRFEVRDRLERWQPHLVILDESHRIKTPNAKKTRMLVRLGQKVPYRLILTGTPVTKKKRVFDVYSQWKFLNPERFHDSPTFAEFKDRYGVWTNRNGFPQWLRNRNVRELRERIHTDAYSVKRKDCYDLPPRVHQVVPVRLQESRPIYEEMAQEMIAQLESGEITEATIKIVQTLRLAQITSGLARTEPSTDHPKGRLVRIGEEKLRVLEELLADLAEADEKVVVCARFKGDFKAISELCQRLKIAHYRIIGGQNRSERDQERREFAKHEGGAVMLMQPAAGGLGIDLSSAAVMVWYSLTHSYVDFTQACDRIALSRRNTTFMYLLAEDSVDEIMHESLLEDRDVAEAITESPHRLLGE